MLCPKCGKQVHENAALCEFCGTSLGAASHEVGGKSENIMMGVLGAIGGCLLGAVSIILFDQIGYVAALSGLILAICTLKGYELLGGTLSKTGVIISVVLMLVTPYLANQASTAISLIVYAKDHGDVFSFFEAFKAVPALVKGFAYKGYTMETDSYYSGLAMIYVFALVGAFSTVRSVLKK